MHKRVKSDLQVVAAVVAVSILVGVIVSFTYKATDEEAQAKKQAGETSYLMYVSGFGANVIGQRDEILRAGWEICATDPDEVRLKSQVLAGRNFAPSQLWQAEAVAAYAYLCPPEGR